MYLSVFERPVLKPRDPSIDRERSFCLVEAYEGKGLFPIKKETEIDKECLLLLEQAGVFGRN